MFCLKATILVIYNNLIISTVAIIAFNQSNFFLYLQIAESNAESKTGTTAESSELTKDATAKTSVS